MFREGEKIAATKPKFLFLIGSVEKIKHDLPDQEHELRENREQWKLIRRKKRDALIAFQRRWLQHHRLDRFETAQEVVRPLSFT